MSAVSLSAALAMVLAVVVSVASGPRVAVRRRAGARRPERGVADAVASPTVPGGVRRRRARRLVVVAAIGVAALTASPAVPLVVAALVALPLAREGRRARRRLRRLHAEVPEVAEVVALALGAGLTVGAALAVAAEHLDGELALEVRTTLREVAVGHPMAAALDRLGQRLGDGARPFAAVLADSDRTGAPAAAALVRLASEGRAWRRRQAEEAARRLPVKLLFPLVGCVLPAFALLTVVPVVAGALRALRP